MSADTGASGLDVALLADGRFVRSDTGSAGAHTGTGTCSLSDCAGGSLMGASSAAAAAAGATNSVTF